MVESGWKWNSLFLLKLLALWNSIHPMQIWRTTPSSPGTSCMKARLVGPRCFVLTTLPQKRLASVKFENRESPLLSLAAVHDAKEIHEKSSRPKSWDRKAHKARRKIFVFLRVTHDGLSESGTARGLLILRRTRQITCCQKTFYYT